MQNVSTHPPSNPAGSIKHALEYNKQPELWPPCKHQHCYRTGAGSAQRNHDSRAPRLCMPALHGGPGYSPPEGTPLAGLACHSWRPAHRAAAARDMHVTVKAYRESQCSSDAALHVVLVAQNQQLPPDILSHRFGIDFRGSMTGVACKYLHTIPYGASWMPYVWCILPCQHCRFSKVIQS